MMVGVAAVVLALVQTGAAAEPAGGPGALAIEGGRVLTMVAEAIEGGTVLIQDGKITAVGRDLEIPDDARRIGARGKTVMPGLIDALSRLYVYPEELAEDKEIAPELRITDAVDPYLKDTGEVLRHGVSAVHVVPGARSLLGGMSAVLKVLAEAGAIRPVTDSAAVRGQIGVPSGSTSSSLQRLATYASIREAFLATRDYLWSWEKYERALARYEKKAAEGREDEDEEKDEDEKEEETEEAAKEKDAKADRGPRPRKPATNPTYETLARVLKREIPLQIEAHRVADILNALRLRDEFDVDLVLLGCSEGHKIAREIASGDVPVIVAPVALSFAEPSRLRYGEHSRANAAALADAGVKVALGVGGGEGLHSKLVRTCAAIAVGEGLGGDEALKAVTVNAAEILGVSDRIGSIAEGRDADVVIIDGEPLDVLSAVETVIMDGEVVFERGAGE
ncbi:MAG: amidohydrolase family protein [Candidatus Brocadiaceae bacterium]|jgi:imidazolonepropionase-like amidohydrolase